MSGGVLAAVVRIVTLVLTLVPFAPKGNCGTSKAKAFFAEGSGYVRLCPLKGQPILQLASSNDGRFVVLGEKGGQNLGQSGAPYGADGSNRSGTDGFFDNFSDGVVFDEDEKTSDISTWNVVEARECPCAPEVFCLMGDGDTCGVPRKGEGETVGCFLLDSRTVFIRNAWPVGVLWYGALFIFLLATENGRNARNYLLSFICKDRNRTMAARIVANESQLRERMRSAAVAQQRRLFLVAQREAGLAYGGASELVLKTKQFNLDEHTKSRSSLGPHTCNPTNSSQDEEDNDAESCISSNNTSPDDKALPEAPSTPVSQIRHKPSDAATPETAPISPTPSLQSDTNEETHDEASQTLDSKSTDSAEQRDKCVATVPTCSHETASSWEDDEDEITCTICIGSVDNGDRIGVLKCNHIFHADCLKDWLRRRNVCPLCQSPDVASPRRRRQDDSASTSMRRRRRRRSNDEGVIAQGDDDISVVLNVMEVPEDDHMESVRRVGLGVPSTLNVVQEVRGHGPVVRAGGGAEARNMQVRIGLRAQRENVRESLASWFRPLFRRDQENQESAGNNDTSRTAENATQPAVEGNTSGG